jgi:hypothetical protein
MAVTVMILKYVGVLISTALGVLGLITTVRDEQTDKITRRGWRLLACIVGSGVVVIATQAFDDIKNDAERAAEAKKTNNLLEQVIRGQYPLRDVRLSGSVQLSLEDKTLTELQNRFLPAVNTARDSFSRGERFPAGIARSFFARDKLLSAEVCRDSPLYPRFDTEPIATPLLSRMAFVLRFYRTPISGKDYPYHPRIVRDAEPDIEMAFDTNTSSSNLCIEYDFSRRALSFRGSDLRAEGNHWRSSGKIISVPDLRGAQVFIDVRSSNGSVATNEEKVLISGLQSVQLRVGDLDDFWIPVANMKKHHATNGAIFWEYRFPPTTDEILALSLFH